MLKQFAQRWALVVGVTLILWVISERIFWSMWRPDEEIGGAVMTIVMYGIATYIALYAIEYFRVRTFWSCMLIGALYGWITEGIVAMTILGAGIPFPFSLSWTALAWHMLISVGAFLYWHRKVLQQSFVKSLIFSGVIGLGWGLWSMTWFFENPPVVTTVSAYALHAFIISACVVLGHVLINVSRGEFRTPVAERVIVFALLGAFFVFITIPTVWPIGVAIVVLAGILYVPLKRHKDSATVKTQTVLPVLSASAPFLNILTIFMAPVMATALYALELGRIVPVFPINFGVLVVTTVAGFIIFGMAWKKTYSNSVQAKV